MTERVSSATNKSKSFKGLSSSSIEQLGSSRMLEMMQDQFSGMVDEIAAAFAELKGVAKQVEAAQAAAETVVARTTMPSSGRPSKANAESGCGSRSDGQPAKKDSDLSATQAGANVVADQDARSTNSTGQSKSSAESDRRAAQDQNTDKSEKSDVNDESVAQAAAQVVSGQNVNALITESGRGEEAQTADGRADGKQASVAPTATDSETGNSEELNKFVGSVVASSESEGSESATSTAQDSKSSDSSVEQSKSTTPTDFESQVEKSASANKVQVAPQQSDAQTASADQSSTEQNQQIENNSSVEKISARADGAEALNKSLAETAQQKLENLAQKSAPVVEQASAAFVEPRITNAQLLMRPVLESVLKGESAAELKVGQVSASQSAQAQSNNGSLTSNFSFARQANSTSQDSFGQAQRSQAPTRIAAQQTMEKVESVLKEAAKARDGSTISLRLDPPSLGSVKVDVTLKDGHLHARVVAEVPAVNQLLRDRSYELQNILRRAGINVDQVSVSVGSDQGANVGFDSAFSGGSNSSQQPGAQQFGLESGQDAARLSAASAFAAAGNNTQLDHWVA